MKRRTLFTISSHHTDVSEIKNTLNDISRANVDSLLAFIKEKIGQLNTALSYCYRVTNMNYVKLHLTGTKQINNEEQPTEFHMTLVIAGYTEFPQLTLATSNRLNMSVTDSTDAFWLVQLLRHELSEGN